MEFSVTHLIWCCRKTAGKKKKSEKQPRSLQISNNCIRKEKEKAIANPPNVSEDVETDEPEVDVTMVSKIDDSEFKNKMKPSRWS